MVECADDTCHNAVVIGEQRSKKCIYEIPKMEEQKKEVAQTRVAKLEVVLEGVHSEADYQHKERFTGAIECHACSMHDWRRRARAAARGQWGSESIPSGEPCQMDRAAGS